MQNFPKLSTSFPDSQLPFQTIKNDHQPFQPSESRKITTASQSRNLSPFTWNNIKLPTVLIKQKLQKTHQIKQKQDPKQPVSKKHLPKNDLFETTKLQTIGEKAKRALNISVELKKMLPQKVSPLKNLHQKVLLEYQKRKLTTELKMRQNRSFTQKDAKKNLAKTFQTMQVRLQDKNDPKINKNDPRLADSHLMKTQQRYRNSRSTYEDGQTSKGNVKRLAQRYKKSDDEMGKKEKSPSKTRQKGSGNQNSEHEDKELIQSLKNSIVIRTSRNSPSKNVHSHSINQQMQPYIRHYLNSLQSSKDPSKPRIFVTTNPKYHPLHLNSHNSNLPASNSQFKTLIWTKLQSLNVFREKTPDQYYNHVEGSHVFTSKQKLHEMLNGGRDWQKQFYPLSFSLPKEYNEFVQEYDWVLVKCCLKFFIKQIQFFQKAVIQNGSIQNPSNLKTEDNIRFEDESQNFTVCLSDILDDLTRDTKNQSQLKMLKFCLFLESGRKKEKLNSFFQRIKTYRSVDITLSESIYIGIIDWCLELAKLSSQNLQDSEEARNIISNSLNFSNIDYRLIQLLKAYDYLFGTQLPGYLYKKLNHDNSWVIKPFAASKAAGISFIINSSQFYTTPDYEYKEYRHRSKYHNKIFMKYIDNPFLIKHSGMDYFVQKVLKDLKKQLPQNQYEKSVQELSQKVEYYLDLQQKFCGRKFDIRQWILIVCDEYTEGDNLEKGNEKMMSSTGYEGRRSPRIKTSKITKFYKYWTGYCRFAQKQYSMTTNDPEVHLTNYEMYKKSLKSDRKSQSPTKDHRSFKSSVLEKNQLSQNQTEEKGLKSEIEERARKRIGSISKDQKESVLMLQDLFGYVDFIGQIKDRKINQKDKGRYSRFGSQIKEKYQSQLDMILESIFENGSKELVHNRGSFELFGVDLLMDEEMNLYLLEVNLNPGCSAGRDEKLYFEAQRMVESMFERVMGERDEEEVEELKQRRIERLQGRMLGSREFIGEVEMDENGKREGEDQREQQRRKEKEREQKMWVLVGEKESH